MKKNKTKLVTAILIINIMILFLIVGITVSMPAEGYIIALFALFGSHLVLDNIDEL